MLSENLFPRNSGSRCQCATLTPFGWGQVAYYQSRPLAEVPDHIAYDPEAMTDFVRGWRDAAGAVAYQRSMLAEVVS